MEKGSDKTRRRAALALAVKCSFPAETKHVNRGSDGFSDRIYRSGCNLKMDTTVQFFATLKKTVVTLESETDRLQQRFENRNRDDETGE